jgi:threonine dehydratase
MPLTADPAAGVTLEDVRAAARRIEGVAARTPLIDIPELSGMAGAPVALKCEQLQPIGAFKIRGAYNAVARLAAQGGTPGIITPSSGNHGQAVAFAARAFGLRAVVVMPASTPGIKVAGVRRHGGEVVFAGSVRSLEQQERAETIAREEGLSMIPPFDHPDVVAGQGTCGLELLEQRPDVDTVLVPVSGGGLLAGISVAVEGIRPSVRVVAVEPEGAAKLSAALAAGEPRTLERTESMADGLLTRSIGRLTFPIIQRVVREVVRVSEEEIASAVRFLHARAGLTVEPSGAVTTAAVLAGRLRLSGPTVLVVSGGNVDPDLFQRLVE